MRGGGLLEDSVPVCGDEQDLDHAECAEDLRCGREVCAWAIFGRMKLACSIMELSGNKIYANINNRRVRVHRLKIKLRE